MGKYPLQQSFTTEGLHLLTKTENVAFRYESPIAPNVEVFRESAVEAFPIAVVGFAVAFSVAKVYSIKHDYTIDGNQVRGRDQNLLIAKGKMSSTTCIYGYGKSQTGIHCAKACLQGASQSVSTNLSVPSRN